MRVSRLEIFGFKSFMERLVLPFDGGLTGVVGPNGCGKSNIVDAVRWVLGETHAKNLRGSTLEDVIFNGTSELRPLGLAEVSITLRADGKTVYDDIAANLAAEQELGVQLAAEEGAESTAAENDAEDEVSNETASDENEQASDSEQSENSNASQARPRFTVLDGGVDKGQSVDVADSDDAAGQDAAEDKKAAEEETDSSTLATILNRFPWIKHASEVQVTRRLYRSGEAEFFINQLPCRLRDMKELLRVVGMSPRSHTIIAQGEVAKIIHAKPEERRMILEDAAGVLGFRDKINAANRRLKETADNLERIEDITREVTRQVASLKRQAQRAENREGLKNSLFEADTTVLHLRLRTAQQNMQSVTEAIQSAQAEHDSLVEKLEELQQTERDVRGRLLATDVEGDSLRTQIDSLRYEINERAEKLLKKKSRLGEVQAFLKAGETERKRYEERMHTLSERSAEVQKLVQSLEEQSEAIAALIPKEERVDDSKLRQAEVELKNARTALRQVDERIRSLREELAGQKGALVAYEKQIQALSPSTALGSKEFHGALQNFLRSEGLELHALVDCLEVPRELAKAVQAVLREKSDHFLSADWKKIAQWFSDAPEKLKKDVRTFGLLSTGSKTEHKNEFQDISDETGITLLRNKIRITNDAYAPVVEVLFSGVYVVSTLEQALRVFDSGKLRDDARIVTASGEVLSKQGYALLSKSGGVLELQALHSEIAQKVESLSKQIETEQQGRTEHESAIQASERVHSEELRQYEERQAKLRALLSERAVLQGRLGSEKRTLAQFEGDIQRAKDGEQTLLKRQEELLKEEEVLQQELTANDAGADKEAHEKLRMLNEEYRKLEERRAPDRELLQRIAGELGTARTQSDSARRKVDELNFQSTKLNLEETHSKSRFEELYGADVLDTALANVPDDAELQEADLSSLEQEAKRLRERIQREGEVDPGSIEEHRKESERLLNLETQQKDLKEASKTLQATIERLRSMSEALFLSNFKKVQAQFELLIPRLFGGGRGEIVLADETKPLESGIEIIARPPGKKLKSIDLMSGGEKALCATALIVAMFTVRPAPLCILDEVDAPLDEANLGRFLALVKEMSSTTQFLMITHNKPSMGASDQLVGVTMEQPGASKVLQVSLQEAYQHVA